MAAVAVHAQCEIQTFRAGSIGEDSFGRSVDLQGDVLVVGEPIAASDQFPAGPGLVHVYQFDGGAWEEVATLTAPDRADRAGRDAFGWSVDLDNDVILVGAPDAGHSELGAAYVYRHADDAWRFEARLSASDGDRFDKFGRSVAIDGRLAIVGAWRNDHDGISQAGSAYVFALQDSTWVEEAKLTDAGAEECDLFGQSVSISGDVALIGAHGNDDAGSGTGAAFLFRRGQGTWAFEQQLQASDAQYSAWFGWSVALRGDRAVVGAPQDAGQTGAAYVLRSVGGKWIDEQKLVAADPVGPWPFFGWSVALSDDTRSIVVGAPQDRALGNDAGAAHVFVDDGSGWEERAKLVASGGKGGLFGISAAVDGGLAAFGAPAQNAPGAAYVFAGIAADADCNENGVADACDIASGTSDDVNGNGIPDECERVGDINRDGRIDVADLLLLLQDWGDCPKPPLECPSDLNGNGAVETADLLILLGNWG